MASESETMRAEFEAWFRNSINYRRGQTSFKCRSYGAYHDLSVQERWGTWQAAWSRAPSAEAKDAEPDPALLISMACCLNHGFSLLPQRQQDSMLHDMRKLWDETQGRGYYRPENRDRYTAMHAAIAQQEASRG